MQRRGDKTPALWYIQEAMSNALGEELTDASCLHVSRCLILEQYRANARDRTGAKRK